MFVPPFQWEFYLVDYFDNKMRAVAVFDELFLIGDAGKYEYRFKSHIDSADNIRFHGIADDSDLFRLQAHIRRG